MLPSGQQIDDAVKVGQDVADLLPPILQGVGVLIALQVVACLGIVYLLAKRKG